MGLKAWFRNIVTAHIVPARLNRVKINNPTHPGDEK
jgi:hypothetical protein